MEGGLRGLVIVFSAFMIQVLAFGNYAAAGVFTVHLLEVFDHDAVGVSLITSIHFATLMCSGPIISFLMTKVSCRKLCLLGAALIVIGVFCTPLIRNLLAMYIFFGVIAGVGVGLIYLPSHILCGLYFVKYRSLVTGVATAGTGTGAMVLPPVCALLIEAFTWRGALKILAGLDTLLFVFALFMVPPSTAVETAYPSVSSHDEVKPAPLINDQEDVKDMHFALPTNEHEKKNGESDSPRKPASNSLLCRTAASSRLTRDSKHHVSNINMTFMPSYIVWRKYSCATEFASMSAVDGANLQLHKSATASSRNLPSPTGIRSEGTQNVLDAEEIFRIISSSASEDVPKIAKGSLKQHFALLCDFNLLIFYFDSFVWSLTTSAFLTFGPDFITLKGHSDKNAALLFTFFGVGQLVGGLMVSFLSTLGGWIPMYIGGSVFCGISLFVSPMFSSFVELVVVLLCLGFCYGGLVCLCMMVIIQLLGMENLSIGMGYFLFVCGIGCFLGPPAGGLLYTAYGRYREPLYMAGAVTVFGGLIMILIYVPRCWKKQEQR